MSKKSVDAANKLLSSNKSSSGNENSENEKNENSENKNSETEMGKAECLVCDWCREDLAEFISNHMGSSERNFDVIYDKSPEISGISEIPESPRPEKNSESGFSGFLRLLIHFRVRVGGEMPLISGDL